MVGAYGSFDESGSPARFADTGSSPPKTVDRNMRTATSSTSVGSVSAVGS